MTVQRQALYWLCVLGACLLFLYAFSSILLPFIAGTVIAYILDPLADRLERLKFSRLWATISILLLFILVFVIGLLIVVPVLGNQLNDFISQLPGLVRVVQAFFLSDAVARLSAYLPFEVSDIKTYVEQFANDGAKLLGKVLQSLLSGGQFVLDFLSLLVIAPVVAFYLLYDWDTMIAKIDTWLPRDHASVIRRLAAEMSDMIAGFVRAQGLICLILGLFYAVALSLTGLSFGLLIGIGIGVLSFIPFIGAILGALLSIGVALAQFVPQHNYLMIVIVAGIFVCGQLIEGNLLQPRLMGHHVQLHPVWLMFALIAFGSVFGLVGMLVAVPATACIGVLVRFALQQYLQSPLYLGSNPPHDRAE